MKTVTLGIIGFGTVGAGVAETILNNGKLIADRSGFMPVLKRIVDLDITSCRGVTLPEGVLSTNSMDILDDPDIQIVIELVGGTTFAREIILQALRRGKSVVTANKALLATHGEELFRVAGEHGVDIGFEASVGGGIPCIKALREGLVGNHIKTVLGILNGTCNYILSCMESEHADFDQVLSAAQAAGYAEADPALDVDGIDTAHKAAILASLAFGRWFNADEVRVQGIRSVTVNDIVYAAEMGYRIKLLAIIKEIDGRIELGVQPALVPTTSLIGNVHGVFNAVWVQGDVVGNTMYYGRGAGRQATASAVVADIVDISLNILRNCAQRQPAFRTYQQYDGLMASEQIVSRYYIRLQIEDKPGVLAKVSGLLGAHDISIATVAQKEMSQPAVPMIILTHQAPERSVLDAMSAIGALSEVFEKPVLFRLEELEQ
jgi:homoserine dehydrogenase